MTTGWGSDACWCGVVHPVGYEHAPGSAAAYPSLARGLWQPMPQVQIDYEAIGRELGEASPEDRIEAAMRYMRRILYGPEDEEHLDGTEPS